MLLVLRLRACYRMQQTIRTHDYRYEKYSLVRPNLIHLHEDFIYGLPSFDQRKAFLLFMYMGKYVSEQQRLDRLLNHVVANLGSIQQLITIAGFMREMAKLDSLPENSERQIGRHGMKLLENIFTSNSNYRNMDPTILNTLLGYSSDFGILAELLTPEVSAVLSKLKKRMLPSNLIVNIDILGGRQTRHLPLLQQLIDELIYLQDCLSHSDLDTITSYGMVQILDNPSFTKLAERLQTRLAATPRKQRRFVWKHANYQNDDNE